MLTESYDSKANDTVSVTPLKIVTCTIYQVYVNNKWFLGVGETLMFSLSGCDTEIFAGGGTSPNLCLINYSLSIIAYTLDIDSQFRGHEHSQF